MPYALASGFFRPGSAEASAILRYLLDHGGRFLGLVRFAPHTGVTNPGYQRPGTDDVYGTNVARFLADNDQPEQLLLSLYGKLAAGMTQNTFVSGEGSTVGPVKGQYYRSMHRPPNSANNAFFLETLRLTLVHETTDSTGQPQGLELAYSTPRAWLEQGKQIAVRRLQTSFGPLTYTIDSAVDAVHVQLDVPTASPARCGCACDCRTVSASRQLRSTARRGTPSRARRRSTSPAWPATSTSLSRGTDHGSRQNEPVRPTRSRIAWFCSRVCGRQSGSSRSPHHATASSPSCRSGISLPAHSRSPSASAPCAPPTGRGSSCFR